MREIELKFKVENTGETISILEQKNCQISPIIYQNDTIYVKDLKDIESKEGSIWLRVRKTDDTVELNYKKQSSKKMESEEIEFEVNSYEKANEFLNALGFKKWVEVNKKRRFAKYKKYNICIDEVERLGSFIEIELLTTKLNDTTYYEQELLALAKELKINTDLRIDSHYDTMISELD